MNWIWLCSSPGGRPASFFGASEIMPADCAEEAREKAAQYSPARIIIEVGDGDDSSAREMLAALTSSGIVWIYHPSANSNCSLSFQGNGATQVFTTQNELREAMSSTFPGRGSSAMRSVTEAVHLVASRHCTVLIEGETGTGKEVVARDIHRTGSRSRGPFVAINCSAIPEALLEAELFGHTRGAFTGAVQPRAGKFEAAQRGTILLDEIGDMPLPTQTKLLRVLQEKEIERLGGNDKTRLDVRVIAATNVNLAERVRDGKFRQDLFFRLNVFQIVIPPLRHRKADILSLARHFLMTICAREQLPPKHLDQASIEKLLTHDWPGNVRELENVLDAAIIRSTDRSLVLPCDICFAELRSLPAEALRQGRYRLPAGGLNYQEAIESLEHDLLTQALVRTRGNKTAAADLLQLKRTTLAARLRALESRLPQLAA